MKRFIESASGHKTIFTNCEILLLVPVNRVSGYELYLNPHTYTHTNTHTHIRPNPCKILNCKVRVHGFIQIINSFCINSDAEAQGSILFKKKLCHKKKHGNSTCMAVDGTHSPSKEQLNKLSSSVQILIHLHLIKTGGVLSISYSTVLYGHEMWCCRRIAVISWTDGLENEDVLQRIAENKNIQHTIKQKKPNATISRH